MGALLSSDSFGSKMSYLADTTAKMIFCRVPRQVQPPCLLMPLVQAGVIGSMLILLSCSMILFSRIAVHLIYSPA